MPGFDDIASRFFDDACNIHSRFEAGPIVSRYLEVEQRGVCFEDLIDNVVRGMRAVCRGNVIADQNYYAPAFWPHHKQVARGLKEGVTDVRAPAGLHRVELGGKL